MFNRTTSNGGEITLKKLYNKAAIEIGRTKTPIAKIFECLDIYASYKLLNYYDVRNIKMLCRYAELCSDIPKMGHIEILIKLGEEFNLSESTVSRALYKKVNV